MASKVGSARIVTRTGIPAIVAPGREQSSIVQVLAGLDVGTLFVPGGSVLSARKHWIAFSLKPQGTLSLDAGAVKALVEARTRRASHGPSMPKARRANLRAGAFPLPG